MMKHVYSVGQVNKYIKNMFAQDFMTFYMNTGGAFLFWLALGYLIQSVTSKNSEAKEITQGK